MKRPVLHSFVCVVVTLLSSLSLHADFIDVRAGSHDLLPNTAGQIVEIMVWGDGTLQGLNFEAQIGNGKTGEVPAITNVDIVGPGVLFGLNNNNDNGLGSGAANGYAGFWNSSTTTSTGTVTPDLAGSILGRVEINTMGFGIGSSFELILNNGVDVLTNFAGWGSTAEEQLRIYNGTVNVVPEPSAVLLLLAGAFGIASVVRRRAR